MRKIIDAAVKDHISHDAEVQRSVAPLIKSVRGGARSLSISTQVIIGGSLAKGTLLKGDYDIDIFVVFPQKYRDKDLSKLLKRILVKGKINAELIHGSRDYFRHALGDVNVEMVPVLKVSDPSKAQNVTDMSPLHVIWLKKRITRRLADDIRAAKLFCKSLRIYGAESYVRGFSGHVLDILVIRYNGFDRLMRAASKWKIPTVIDPMRHHGGKATHILNRSKIGPLIVVDPIDPLRNAAAAVNEQSMKAFIAAARSFVRKASLKHFEPYIFSLDSIMKGGKKVVLVLPKVPKGKDDVVGAKLLKDFESLSAKLHAGGFDVLSNGWFWDQADFAAYWFRTEKRQLSPTRVHEGPFIRQESHCKAFKRKYRKAVRKGGRLVAKVKVQHRKPESLIRSATKAEILVYEP